MIKKTAQTLSTDIEKGASSEPRLEFFTDFLATIGDSAADVARTLGLTRAGVGHWINNDDCKLSYCEQYINAKGYELDIELMKKNVKTSGRVMINIETRIVDAEDIQCRRLFFLHAAITKLGVTKVKLAKDMDLKYNTVRHWFVVDDIYVSHIFTIADLYDLQVCINIRPKDNE